MSHRLNLTELRAGHFFGTALVAEAASSPVAALSRRDFLGLGGGALFALSLPSAAVASTKDDDTFTFRHHDNKAVFSIGGAARWTIDSKIFAGNPQLLVEQPNADNDFYRIDLKNALLPGTDLRADLSCEIRKVIDVWTMTLQLSHGFRAQVDFLQWLRGETAARSAVDFGTKTVCAFAENATLLLRGRGEMSFAASWLWQIEGEKIAQLNSENAPLFSDQTALRLASAHEPSLLEIKPLKRTFILLERHEYSWSLGSIIDESHSESREWKLISDGEVFDSLCVECGENRFAKRSIALLAQGGASGKLAFQPLGATRRNYHEVAHLALANARLAMSFDGDESHCALLARFDDSSWIHGETCSVQVGNANVVNSTNAHSAPFELTSDGQTMSLRCAPSLLAASLSLPDAICEPVQFSNAPPLHFEYSKVQRIDDTNSLDNKRLAQRDRIPIPFPIPLPRPRRTPRPVPEPQPTPNDDIQIDDNTRVIKPETDIGRVTVDDNNLGILFPTNLSISVVRPEDLLVLRFEFLNLRLQTGNGGGQLQQSDNGKAAYIVVHFPPQNIAEQAFLEPPDALPSNFKTPVKSRIAGPSRLVFRVPNDAAPIPYTLKDLLRVCGEYPLSVAATAKLPKYPFTKLFILPSDKIFIAPSVFSALPRGDKREDGVLVARAQLPKWSVFSRAHAQRETDKPRRNPTLPDILKRIPDVFKKTPKTDKVIKPDDLIVISPGVFAVSKPYAPRLFETAIESPYRLIVSPNADAGWAHSTELQLRDSPKAAGKVAELWHTRLGVRTADGVDETTSSTRTLRAIWSPDYNPQFPTGSWPRRAAIGDDSSYRPFRMSLESWDRHQLVAYTADFTKPKADERFLETSRLMLSSLGSWMNVRAGFTDLPLRAFPGFDLEAWTHRATMGRDHYVRVVKKGFLFPFGHRASLVQVTERKFAPQPGTSTQSSPGFPIAVLRQRFFIIVREPEKIFPAVGQRFEGRTMPFKRVRITTLVTPNMEVASPKAIVGTQSSGDAIWPVANNARFPFHLIGEDLKGNVSEFTAPLIFVTAAGNAEAPNGFAYDKAKMNAVNVAYIAAPEAVRPFAGQNIAYAPETAQNPGTTTYETQSVHFAADTTAVASDATLIAADQPHFYPIFAVIEARIPPVQQLLGNDRPAVVALSPFYVNNAFDTAKNKGEVLFEMVQKNDFGLEFPTDKSGGLATPNIQINALSRKFGPVGGAVADFAGGKFKPEEYFAGMKAKILGGIDLFEIIGVPSGFNMGDGKNVPKLVTKLLRDGNGVPTGNRTELNWQPDVKEFLIFQPTASTKLTLLAVLEAKLDSPTPPSLDITGELTKFQINFFEFVKLNFDLLGFYAKAGKKLDITAEMESGNEVEFGGPLKFINTIKKYIPADGFSDPPSLDISPAGITAGYTLGLPTIAIGVFSLSNVTLGAALTLPFTGDPVRFRFNFCERENPFTLVVSLFGGGGFFALGVGVDGVEVLEASIEFGGAIAFDIGVASGGVYVMAGIYFKWENDACELTGYLRLGGCVEVLGIITISVEFYMGLTYASGGKVAGEAKLTVEVEVLFFSASVTLKVRREFGGSSGSAALPQRRNNERFAQGARKPSALWESTRSHADVSRVTVRDVMSESDWIEYCGAFA